PPRRGSRVRISQELRVGGADRLGGIEVGIRPRRERIVDDDEVAVRVSKVAEVALAGHRRWHRVDENLPALFLQPRIIAEEERPAVTVVDAWDHERATDRTPELMAIERRDWILLQPATRERNLTHEEIPRVECVVAQILEH